MATDDLIHHEQIAAEARATLADIEAEYHEAEQTLLRLADHLAEARLTAERASGRAHLARIRAMFGGGI
ncbi:MAG: hypothetical protein IPG66_11785 [Hydrogenophilales bacterium]|nr:hypothetical protein [Hydrogenophilales bacterium]